MVTRGEKEEGRELEKERERQKINTKTLAPPDPSRLWLSLSPCKAIWCPHTYCYFTKWTWKTKLKLIYCIMPFSYYFKPHTVPQVFWRQTCRHSQREAHLFAVIMWQPGPRHPLLLLNFFPLFLSLASHDYPSPSSLFLIFHCLLFTLLKGSLNTCRRIESCLPSRKFPY